jgi:hypothetical protein
MPEALQFGPELEASIGDFPAASHIRNVSERNCGGCEFLRPRTNYNPFGHILPIPRYTRSIRHPVDIGVFAEKEVIQ